MTSANGQPVGNPRRPSAAFPREPRGALPPGHGPRTATAVRVFSLALLAAALAAPPALAAKHAQPASGQASVKRDASRVGKPFVYRAKAKRYLARNTQRHGTRAVRVTRAPRLPDAPMELLPAPRVIHAFQMEPVQTSPRAACLTAARRAERIHGLPDGLMVAIALSESGLHAHALNIGGRAYFPETPEEARALLAAAPGRSSVMAGCVQVNARVHARNSDWPLDAERSADWAGGMLHRWYSETGSWTTALARWHGGSPASTRRVLCRVRAKLEATAPGSPVLADQGCAGSVTARDRQNGAVLLNVAEMRVR